jgi:hypothetical protein
VCRALSAKCGSGGGGPLALELQYTDAAAHTHNTLAGAVKHGQIRRSQEGSGCHKQSDALLHVTGIRSKLLRLVASLPLGAPIGSTGAYYRLVLRELSLPSSDFFCAYKGFCIISFNLADLK